MTSEDNRKLEEVSKDVKQIMISGCITAVVNSLFGPVIQFILGWIGGSILNWCVGGWVVSSLNTLFDTTRFTQNMLPPLFAVISMFLGYLSVYKHKPNDIEKKYID